MPAPTTTTWRWLREEGEEVGVGQPVEAAAFDAIAALFEALSSRSLPLSAELSIFHGALSRGAAWGILCCSQSFSNQTERKRARETRRKKKTWIEISPEGNF